MWSPHRVWMVRETVVRKDSGSRLGHLVPWQQGACTQVMRDAPSSRRLSPYVPLWGAHVEILGRQLETGIRSAG